MDVVTVDAGQMGGSFASTGTQRPGEVRPEIRVNFESTMKHISTLITKVERLAQHAENMFWDTRKSDLEIYGYCTRNGETAAAKLCLAAHPMLNEILERLAYVSDETWEELGEATDDTDWDVSGGSPTRTFYLPTVQAVCRVLRNMVTRMGEWSKNSEGWEDMQAIRDLYGDGLSEFYTQARAVVNELGPLWAPVICDKYPVAIIPDSMKDYSEQWCPLSLKLMHLGTTYMLFYFYFTGTDGYGSGPFLDSEDYDSDVATLLGSKFVYRNNGGLVHIKINDSAIGESDNFVNGIYEISEASSNLNIFPKQDVEISEIEEAEYTGTNFVFRFVRKAEPLSEDYICVRYHTTVNVYPECINDILPECHHTFKSGDNTHYPPIIAANAELLEPGTSNYKTVTQLKTDGYYIKWKRYDETVHSGSAGSQYDASSYSNPAFEDLDENTFFELVVENTPIV